MRKQLPFLAISFLIILITACSKGSDTNTGGGGSGGGGSTPGPLFTAVKAIMQNNCAVAGCHANPGPQNGLNFADDNTIVAQKGRIKVRAVDEAGTGTQMPPPPRAALIAADRQKIVDWINAGGLITN